MIHRITDDHRTRFAVTGVLMTLLHLAVFQALSPLVLAEVANATAFVVVTQANFLVSYHWTWASRRTAGREPLRKVLRRAVLFNASVAVAFASNAAAFWAVHRLAGLHPTASVLAATVVSAAVSYLVSSRVVFARASAAARSALVEPAQPAPAR
ncbi:GtrA family protein [Quadrisphaera sp. KR29]|uniref:GtrA family protein n=1 Tax=Quadrisphaera sp. KR29 TaxID=3461391 RepID=UPI004044C72B